MDDQDLRLIQLLVHDPRATYRELADGLNVSVQAVHRRLQLLQEGRVIMGFSVALSLPYLEAVPVTIYGRAGGRSRAEVIAALDGNDLVSGVLFGSGNVMYVSAFLRKIGELDDFVDLVKKAADMAQPRVYIESVKSRGKDPRTMATDPLSSLDMRIVASLARDGRKASTEVAKELNVTAATVNRRLERMMDMGALEFIVMLHPGFSGDVVAINQVDLREGADRQKVVADLRSRLGPSAEYYRTFSNVPDQLTFVSWTKSLRELELLLDEVAKAEAVRRVVPDIIFTGWYHPSWRDKLVMGPPPPA